MLPKVVSPLLLEEFKLRLGISSAKTVQGEFSHCMVFGQLIFNFLSESEIVFRRKFSGRRWVFSQSLKRRWLKIWSCPRKRRSQDDRESKIKIKKIKIHSRLKYEVEATVTGAGEHHLSFSKCNQENQFLPV